MFEQRFSMFFYEKLVVKFLVPYWSGTCTGLKLIKVSLPITEQNPKTVFLGGKQSLYVALLPHPRQIYSKRDGIQTKYNIVVDVEILEGNSEVDIRSMWNDLDFA